MLKIIHENSFFIAIEKPHGVSIHNESPSLQVELVKNKLPLHFVNRLDSETSGIVLVALKPEFHEPLRKALDEGQKKYIALLRGNLLKRNSEKKISWSWPISDKSEGRQNPQGLKKDQIAAQTEVEVLRASDYFTEIEVLLKTGRQHQIRKHAALSKHPIVGDKRYNDPKYNQKIAQIYNEPRMLLHAKSLLFHFNNQSYHIESLDFILDQYFT